MLPSKHRLVKTTEIAAVQTRGRRFFDQDFVLKVSWKAQAQPKIAFVVSTKVSKKAVERNRIKRMLREAVRTTITDWKSGNYVVIVKPSATKLDNLKLKSAFNKFLKALPIRS